MTRVLTLFKLYLSLEKIHIFEYTKVMGKKTVFANKLYFSDFMKIYDTYNLFPQLLLDITQFVIHLCLPNSVYRCVSGDIFAC